jgi:hypothetical protein
VSRLKDQHAAIWEAMKTAHPITRPVEPRLRLDRYKNKAERSFARDYLDPLVHAGEIRSYSYEAIKFRLGDGAYFTPDFLIVWADEVLEIAEVKGFLREAARVRFLVARDLYPQFRWRMWGRQSGAWVERKV